MGKENLNSFASQKQKCVAKRRERSAVSNNLERANKFANLVPLVNISKMVLVKQMQGKKVETVYVYIFLQAIRPLKKRKKEGASQKEPDVSCSLFYFLSSNIFKIAEELQNLISLV